MEPSQTLEGAGAFILCQNKGVERAYKINSNIRAAQ
jgi:hypothetical protein